MTILKEFKSLSLQKKKNKTQTLPFLSSSTTFDSSAAKWKMILKSLKVRIVKRSITLWTLHNHFPTCVLRIEILKELNTS